MTLDPQASPSTEIEQCESIVRRLHKMCCEPNRSPRMQEIEDGLVQARSRLSDGVSEESAREVIAILTGIGAQLGGLQVECCAPERMPLYAKALEGLTQTQLSLNAQLGNAH